MELVSIEEMVCKCSECGATHKTNNMKDFKESNTYPPYVYFMCHDCKQISKLDAEAMPKRVKAYLVNKIAHERFGNVDQRFFNTLNDI